MQFGRDNKGCYIEYNQCQWAVGNLREEYNRRARDIISLSEKIILGISSGVDSQAALRSFMDQGIDIETAFLYMPGYNDNEYQNLKELEHAWQFKSHIIDIDPMACKEEILAISKELNIPPFQILHRKFLSQLPDVNFLQGGDGPLITFINSVAYFYEGYNTYEMSRKRAGETLGRTAEYLLFDKTSEMVVSSVKDEIMTAFINAHRLYTKQDVRNIDWWDTFIKPMYYGKYWGKDLIYFPKFAGAENIDYVIHGLEHDYRKDHILVPVDQLLADLQTTGARYHPVR
jgi:hypothetical protein